MNPLRILHLSASVGKYSFGIGPVVLGIASSQQAFGHNVSICSLDSEEESRELEDEYGLLRGTIRVFPRVGPPRFAFSPKMGKYLTDKYDDFDVVHAHGIWTLVSRLVNSWRGYHGRPTIIAPHGSLNSWALKRSRLKKRLALYLYERENLCKASCLYALSLREAFSFRDFGLSNPIAIIPNGISINWLLNKGNAIKFRSKFGIPSKTRIILYLGRITPIKGLPLLLNAMALIHKDILNWRLIIAGKDEFGHLAELNYLISKNRLQQNVQILDPLFGKDKRDAFAAAELFVLPSYDENFGVVVAEALGAGVPVLTTKGTPWEEISLRQCGWWTEISVEGIANSLKEALSKSSDELRLMGMNGMKLISEKYTWDKIGIRTIQLYRWLMGESKKPDFVI